MASREEHEKDHSSQGWVSAPGGAAVSLQQANALLRGTIEGAPDMIAVEDTTAHYLAFNRAYHAEFKKVFGVDLKVGDSMIEALTKLPEEQQAARQLFEQTMSGKDFIRNMMERQTRQMGRLVEDLLDISRIAQGKITLKMEQIDLLKVVQIAIETSLPRLDAQRHRLVLCLPGHPVRIKADPARLEPVLANLLNNAAKYSEPEKEIWLSVVVADGQVSLQVKDQGIGIAPEVLPRIFDLYSQAERALGHSQGGLGIGLSLVQGLVTMHGGSVKARSAGVGQGSEFTVRLPILTEGVAETGGASASVGGSGVCGPALSILVVDDNEDEAQSLGLLLKMCGHQISTAYSGPAALEAARLIQPEVVLLNLGLPGLGGCEVARHLLEGMKKRPLLIAVTGFGHEESRRQAAEAGFDHYLVKPVELEKIHQLLLQAA